jgi:hypothetical protein
MPYSAYCDGSRQLLKRQMTQEQRVKALVADYLSDYSPQGEPPKPKRDTFSEAEHPRRVCSTA